MQANPQLNVLGKPLQTCSLQPLTGFTRNGCCDAIDGDRGQHTVCAEVTEAFLDFSKLQGNDLITPRPEFDFPGLRPGDRWCLCAARWQQACDAGLAPPVILEATNQHALAVIEMADLLYHAKQTTAP
jgi:uncharacterized protein (DUF2237 family)